MTRSIRKAFPSLCINAGLCIGYKFPMIRALTSYQAVVLLYHGVPATGDDTGIHGTTFEQHIAYLKQYCHFIAPEELGTSRRALEKPRILLTFDDGFRNNAEVVAPILRKYDVPAVFFVCSRHATPGKYLWFAYLQALEQHFPNSALFFRGERMDMSPQYRHVSVQRLTQTLLQLSPHPSAMYQAIEEDLPQLEEFLDQHTIDQHYAGMTPEQVGALSADPLFSLGVHTVDHPFLSQCSAQDVICQIQDNKSWLEEICGKSCDAIAYPSGDYDSAVLQCTRHFDFTHGYAVVQHLKTEAHLEIPRVGIYSASLHALGFKVQWGRAMRALGIKIG